MEENNKIISLSHVSKVYDGVTVVDDFNLDITKGEFVTFLGPSGCGKTTTLRMIAGFETPSEGSILLNGNDITKLPPYKRPVNTVFQRYALFPHLDVYDNVAFGLKLKKVPVTYTTKKGVTKTKLKHLSSKVIDEKVARALKIVDLEELEDRDISTLSGGQQQRVAIARAIVNEPEILLLDEPLGALDLKMRKEMQLELKAMHDKLGITFIYVTHDQEEALTMSDTIVVMKAGQIQQVGTPKDIYNEPNNAYVANFIGESNIYNATMMKKKVVRFLGANFNCLDDFPVNEKVDVVIRPEDVELKRIGKDGNITAEIKEKYKEKLIGIVDSKVFKGIHFEYVVLKGKNEIVVQDTKEFNVGDVVLINIGPNEIHIMKKELTTNVFTDAYIDKNNKLIISDCTFDCELTQLLSDSHLDENGYLIGPDNKKYDLKDADVFVEIGLSDIEILDHNPNEDENIGEIISIVYKGDHYQYLIRTKEEEDFVCDSEYAFNENDIVSINVLPKNIKLTLKGSITKYEVE